MSKKNKEFRKLPHADLRHADIPEKFYEKVSYVKLPNADLPRAKLHHGDDAILPDVNVPHVKLGRFCIEIEYKPIVFSTDAKPKQG
jgi:hypothetical protein